MSTRCAATPASRSPMALVFTGFTDGTAVALRASTGSVAWITSDQR